MNSIALSINVYQDALALRGLLETATSYFDNIFVIHSGPGGAYSTDGTIELCEDFGIRPVFDDMDKGFGHVRTRLIHESGCEWAMILDADERFHPVMPVLHCAGHETQDLKNLNSRPDLTVTAQPEVCNQGERLKELIQDPRLMAVRTCRRHWKDFTMRNPTQNWLRIPDHQLRIVRNDPSVGYVRDVMMHEKLLDSRTGRDPEYAEQDRYHGPFHDHYHVFFRKARPGTKEFNEANYGRLERREKMIAKT